MMRRVLVTSAAVLSLALVAPFSVQAQGIYIEAGPTFPTGDAGDALGTGWFGAAGLNFLLGDAGLWAGGEVSYGMNSFDGPGDANFSALGLHAQFGYNAPTEGSIDPYIFVGGGLMSLDSDLAADSQSEFGYQLAVGALFGEMFFAELRYQGADEFKYFAPAVGVSFNLANN